MLEVPSFYEEMKNNVSYKETQHQHQHNMHSAESSNVFLKQENLS